MKDDSYYRPGEDLSFTAVSHEEERALFKKAKAGDDAAKEQIIRNHLLLVANIARKLCKGQLPEDQVVSAANFALMKAYENFKPEFPNRFSGFLTLHVRGEIARLWLEQNVVHKTDFSDGEPITSVPLNEESAEEAGYEDRGHKDFLIKLSEQAKSVLDPREREVVDLLFCETPTNQAEVARKLKLSRERIRQVLNGAIQKLQKELRRLMNLHGIE